MTNETIKPCPFCGTPEPVFTTGSRYSSHCGIECERCKAVGPLVDIVGQSTKQMRDMAVFMWNNRNVGDESTYAALMVQYSQLKEQLDNERDHNDRIENALETWQDDADKLGDLLEIALCMLDRKPADILRKHAESLGVSLTNNDPKRGI